MSARSRAAPWFARTFKEACQLASEGRRRREVQQVIAGAWEEWQRGGNPTVTMRLAERFFERNFSIQMAERVAPFSEFLGRCVDDVPLVLQRFERWMPDDSDSIEADLARARKALP